MHRLIVEDGFASALGQPGAQNLSRRRPYRILWFPGESVRGANPPEGMLLILIRRATSGCARLRNEAKTPRRPSPDDAPSRMVPIKKILGAAKDDHAGGRPQERSIATSSRCFSRRRRLRSRRSSSVSSVHRAAVSARGMSSSCLLTPEGLSGVQALRATPYA
jgi:hypothetical protein